MKLRIGHLADLHLGAGTAFGEYDPASGLNTFTLEQVTAAKAAISEMANKKCTYLLIVGDVFDYPNPPDKLNVVFQGLIDHAVDVGMTVIVKTGNHEKEDDRADALMALHRESDSTYQYIGHGRALETSEGIVFSDQNVEHTEGHFHIGLYHGIIEGSLAGGFLLKAPPVQVASTVKLLLLGDVHLGQHGQYKGIDYYYPGSLVRLNFNEKDYDPGYGICTIDTATWTYVYERVSTVSYSRQFVEIDSKTVLESDDHDAQCVAPRSIVKVTGPAQDRIFVEKIIARDDAILFRYIEVGDEKSQAAALPKSNEFNVRKVIARLPLDKYVRDMLAAMTTEEEFTGLTGAWYLHEISIEGFGPYEPTQISFPVDKSINVIGKVGASELDSNGAGKSLIFDAIKTCLYGTTYRGLSTGWMVRDDKATLVIKLRHSETDATVEVRRTIEKGTGAGKQTLTVKLNGIEQTQDRIGDTQTFIARLLGVSDQTFEICTMIGQQGLSLVDKTSAFRVDYMVDLFKMGDVDTIADMLASEERDVEASLNILTPILVDARTQLTTLLSTPVSAPNPFALIALEEKKKAAEQAIGGLRQSIIAFDQQNRDIDAWNAEIVRSIGVAANASVRAHRTLDAAIQVHEQANTALNEALLARDRGDNTCPTCGAPMDKEHAEAHIKELNDAVTDAMAKEDEAVRANEKSVADHAVELGKTMKQKVGSVEKATVDSQIVTQQQIVDEMNQAITAHNWAVNSHTLYTARVASNQSAIDNGETDIAALRGQLAFWAYVKRYFNASAIKEQVVNSVKSFLNDTASYYLSRIFGSAVGVQCDVSIQNTKAKAILKFEIYVMRKGGKVPFEQYSKGERGAVRVAVDLAVSQLVSSVCPAQFRFLILDEAMDGLDQAKSEAIADLVKDLTAKRGTVFVVTHKLKIATKFDHVIHVEKTADVSHVYLT